MRFIEPPGSMSTRARRAFFNEALAKAEIASLRKSNPKKTKEVVGWAVVNARNKISTRGFGRLDIFKKRKDALGCGTPWEKVIKVKITPL